MSAAPEKLFNDIAQFISESNALLKEGAVMELAGLDDQVRTLCEAVLELSQDDRVRYADQLQSLLSDLKKLGESMAAHRDEMAREIRALSDHRKANSAYSIIEKIDRKEDE